MSRSVYRVDDDRGHEAPRTYTKTVYKVPDSIRSNIGAEEKTEDKLVIRRSTRDDGPRDSRDDIDVRVTERSRDQERPRQYEDDSYRVTERVTYDGSRDNQRDRDIAYRVGRREDDWDDRRTTVSRYNNRDDYQNRSDHRSEYRSDYREGDRDRHYSRAPSPPRNDTVREFHFERERDYSRERSRDDRRHDDRYEVERYSKETEYYQQPQPAPQPAQPIIIDRSPPPAAPQPIIIREIERSRTPQPIIIREREERRPEPQYEFIERNEVSEEKSLVKREEPPPPAPAPSVHPEPQQDESYFYQRRVREVDRLPRRREESERRSEIRPRDSASNYSSDDSYEYVRRERTVYDDEKDSHHRRHLAEGALAGAAGAAILRKHRKSEGKDGGGRLSSALAGAGVGALGAEAVSRYRSKSRRRGDSDSRSRSRSSDHKSRRGRRDRHKHRSRSRDRSRSRSKSLSRKQQLAVGAGLAGVAALAGYALKNRSKGDTVIVNDAPPPRRSRSRRRRGSPDSYMYDESVVDEESKHRDPDHRNRKIAQAGLASAAAAGIWERYRSKSRGKSKGRGKSGERSKSRVRTGVPIAAAGLGGAALAGLYEKNKASKEAKKEAIIQDEVGGRGRRKRSRSRSRSVPAPYSNDRRNVDQRDMIAYGGDPIYPDGQRSDEEPGVFHRRNRRGSSAGSSPDQRRSRSRSRGKNLAAGLGAAGLGAVAGHEYSKRRDRRRQGEEERDRSRDRSRSRYDERYDDRYDDRYRETPDPYNDPPQGYLPPQQQQANYGNQQAYPESPYFPGPPTAPVGEPAYAPRNDQYPAQQQQQAYPAYNPADFAPPPAAAGTPYDATRGAYGESDATLGAPYPGGGETYAGDPRSLPHGEAPRDERRRGNRQDPDNVSAPTVPTPTAGSVADDERSAPDADHLDETANGERTPRARSSSRVRFDLDKNTELSPEAPRKRETRFEDSETPDTEERRHRRRKHRDRDPDRDRDSDRGSERSDRRSRDRRGSGDLMNDKYERPPRSTMTDDGGDSDTTETLPDRFDSKGNEKSEDPLNDLISGLASRFLGGQQSGSGGGGDGEEEEDRRGRRHRH